MLIFQTLSTTELQEMLKFPVYLTLLAANKYESFDEENTGTTALDHIQAYQCNPLLADFYDRAGQVFQPNLEMLDNQLPKGKFERDVAIKVELRKIKELLRKLDAAHAALMHQSMKAFKEHVSDASDGVLDDYLFPIPIKGLTEQ